MAFRILLLITLIFSCLLLGTKDVSAHLPGQPPFFKINGEYSLLYPVPLTSLEDFNLPQDIATKNYLVGERLEFELDTTQLPVPPEVVRNTRFTWEYGDGGRAIGLKNTHSYQKMGSYILTIYASDGSTPEPQLLQSVLINILPKKDYVLPKSVIKVNNVVSKDSLTDPLKIDTDERIQFDATGSETTSGIKSVRWDFGDGESSDRLRVEHLYKKDLTQVFPVLRIVDSDGFVADSFVEIKNSSEMSEAIVESPIGSGVNKTSVPNLTHPLTGIAVLLIIMSAVFIKGRRR